MVTFFKYQFLSTGFITSEEALLYEKVDCKYNKFWVPLMWANAVLSHARKENHIKTDWGLRMVIEVNDKMFYLFVC